MRGMVSVSKAGPLLWLGIAAALLASPAGSSTAMGVGPVPESPRLGLFYSKHGNAGGIPIVRSARVPDEALLIARDIVDAQLAHRPDIRRQVVANGTRVGIIAPDEGMADLPEPRH